MERDTIGRRQAAERPAEFRGSVKSSLKSGESSRRGHAAGRGPRCWRSHVANGVIVSWASQNSVSCLHPAGADISAISPAVFGMSRGRRPLCRLELLLALHFAAPPFRIETRKDQTIDVDRVALGYSPDRVDALVWAFTDLLVAPMKGEGIFELYRQQAAAIKAAKAQREEEPAPMPQPGSMEWFAMMKKRQAAQSTE